MKLQNELFIRALEGKEASRPPVWMMRQAGRFLPEFRALRAKYDFFTRCQTPELAAQITLMPFKVLDLDAAILFSDILVILNAMDIPVTMKEGVGPWIENPIQSDAAINNIAIPDVEDRLSYVFEAIKLTLKEIHGKVPLIGFAGAPWTVFCYAVQGQGSKGFEKAKALCFSQPKKAHELLQKITTTTISYLKTKVKYGVHAVQIFDSWGGLFSPEDYREFSLPYIQQIVNSLKEDTHCIVFAKGCAHALDTMSKIGASALGIDWTCTPEYARKATQHKITLQGNYDPTKLFAPIPNIEKNVKEMIKRFGTQRYIANLGHGILPTTPVANAKAFVEAIRNYS